jgi:hypothetical protein
LLDRLFIPVEHLRQNHEAFAELERVAFAVEVHFGHHVARQVREPLRAYNRIVVSTALQMELGSGFRPEGGHQADDDDPDLLSDEIYKAKVAVETALRPHLEAPTLEQFLLLSELRASARRGDCFPRIAGASTVRLILKDGRISDHLENGPEREPCGGG